MQILIVVLIVAVLALGWWGVKLNNCLKGAHDRERKYFLDWQKSHDDAEDLKEMLDHLKLENEGEVEAKGREITDYKLQITNLEKRVVEVTQEAGIERSRLLENFQSEWKKVKEEVEEKYREITDYKLQITDLEKRAAAVYQRVPRFVDAAQQTELDRRRMMMLATLADEDPTLFMFLSLVDEHESNELDLGLKMGLNDGDRQYHAGRAASARDLASAIRDIREQGQQLVAKKKAA